MSSHTVAVLGAGGTMGLGMSRNIAEAGIAVRAWNRTREHADPLAQDGITVVDSPAEAVEGADIVITMLSDGDAVLDVAQQFLPQVADDAIWVQASTIGIEATGRCVELAGQHDLDFVDAPVVGTKKPAEEGKLTVLASGAQSLEDRVTPVFDAIGQKTIWVGSEPGQSTRLKVAINTWIVSVVEGLAETLALAEGMGLDPQVVLDTLDGGPLDMPYLGLKGGMMIERSFEPSFKLSLAAKDARLAVRAAEEAGLDLPMLESIAERMTTASDDHGDEDLAATFRLSAPQQQSAAR